MPRGVLLSALLHLMMFALLIVGTPSFAPEAELGVVIPIDLVSFADLAEPEPEPEPVVELPPPEPEPPEPKPRPITESDPAPTEMVELLPQPEPERELEPEPEEEIAELPPKPEPKPERKPKTKVAQAEKKAEEKPEEKKEPEAPPEDRLTSILRNVDKLREKSDRRRTESAEATRARTAPRASALEQMQMVRAIQGQMSRCWQIEPGARDAETLVVEIRVALNPDATVRKAQIVDFERMLNDSFFRSAAENARRAIWRCSPFDLPPNKYEVWRDLTLKFDPGMMFGG